MPHLAGLVCLSAFDLALYDAFGKLHEVKAFECLTQEWLGEMDLSQFSGAGRKVCWEVSCRLSRDAGDETTGLAFGGRTGCD